MNRRTTPRAPRFQTDGLSALWRRLMNALRPTDQELRALGLVAGLFLLGAAARWLRLRGWL